MRGLAVGVYDGSVDTRNQRGRAIACYAAKGFGEKQNDEDESGGAKAKKEPEYCSKSEILRDYPAKYRSNRLAHHAD